MLHYLTEARDNAERASVFLLCADCCGAAACCNSGDCSWGRNKRRQLQCTCTMPSLHIHHDQSTDQPFAFENMYLGAREPVGRSIHSHTDRARTNSKGLVEGIGASMRARNKAHESRRQHAAVRDMKAHRHGSAWLAPTQASNVATGQRRLGTHKHNSARHRYGNHTRQARLGPTSILPQRHCTSRQRAPRQRHTRIESD